MLKKTVLVCSPGNSGSGAIHDLLLSSKIFINPFGEEEYRMVNDPYGLDNLYKSFYENNNFHNYSSSLEDFISYNNFLSNLKVNSNNKKIKLIKDKRRYNFLINDFIRKIIDVEYFGYPQFSKNRLSYFKNLNFKIKNFISSNSIKRPFKLIIPKKKIFFLNEARKLLNGIFLINVPSIKKKQHFLINQGVNIFDPLNSSKYYTSPKIIIVLRDPKSVYFSMKSRKSFGYPGYKLDLFLKWYPKYMKNLKRIKSNKILYIQFEKFFSNFTVEKKKLDKFLNIKTNYGENFDYKKTYNNLFKAKKNLTYGEIKKINLALRKYLFW